MEQKDVNAIVNQAVQSAHADDDLLTALGFREDENGQYVAAGCSVTLYRVGDEWEIDIVTANGGALGCDVPVAKLTGKPAH